MTKQRQLGSLTLLIGLLAFSAAGSAQADFLGYAVDNSDTLYLVDLTTVTATVIGNTGQFLESLALNSNGVLYGAGFNGALYTINTTTGATKLIGNTGLGDVEGLSFNGSTLIGTGLNSTTSLYTINTTTAAATLLVTPTPTVGATRAMTLLSSSTALLAGDTNTGQSLSSVNLTTGVSTTLGAVTTKSLLTGLSRSSAGTTYALDITGNAYTVSATGAFTLLGNTGNQVYLDLAVIPSATVPEPSSLMLCGIATLVGGLTLRHRSRSSKPLPQAA